MFNEECAVARFIETTAAALSATGHPFSIVLLDDGSTDSTVRQAQALSGQYPVRVLEFPHRGIGAILRELIRFARTAAPDDRIVFTEGDGTCDPSFIAAALPLIDGGADIVAGSRYLPGSQVTGFPLRRRLQSAAVNRLCAWRADTAGVSDYSLFARVYRAGMLASVDEKALTTDGFETNAELLMVMLSGGAAAAEVPVSYRYDLKEGPSKLPTARTIAGYLKLLRRK
ncbi:MAG: glycosyltransferase [Deltaproteobacteria bacterium]|nr:glycosyltransferase [Deltaproteobacteria bacterium]